MASNTSDPTLGTPSLADRFFIEAMSPECTALLRLPRLSTGESRAASEAGTPVRRPTFTLRGLETLPVVP